MLKPYGKSRSNFPSEMRNYPIIKPIVDLLLGEKSKRPLNFTVTVQNADTVTAKEQAKKDLIYQNFQKQFANELIKTGQFQGDLNEVQLPQHIVEQFEASYVDNRAIKGQQALDYIMHSQELHDKFQKAWFQLNKDTSPKSFSRGSPFNPHLDQQRFVKAMLYLSKVTHEDGPFKIADLNPDNYEIIRRELIKKPYANDKILNKYILKAPSLCIVQMHI